MRDSVLHLLTNRASNFGSPIFPRYSDYTPHEETEVETIIRDLLYLRPTAGAYHLIGLLAAVYAFPEVYQEFKESDRTYDLADYTKSPTVMVGGKFAGSPQRILTFNRIPIEFPVSFDMSIAYKDPLEVRILAGNTNFDVPFFVRNNKLDIQWPVETGITGLLDPDGGVWAQGSIITINHEPGCYPYKILADILLKNSTAIQYLNSVGLLKNFFSAQSSIEKVAIMALAISNPSLYVI